MSQDFSQSKIRQIHHILIIDDSARIRQTLAESIVANCLATGKIFKVFYGDKDGKYTQGNPVPRPGRELPGNSTPAEAQVVDEFTVYTAPSPKQALFVLNSPVFSRLTIISDIVMAADTEVGLVGMLEAIARRNLPVNLVFASSDPQNAFVVAKLIETNKAYFLDKQSRAWEDLPRALVQRTDSFVYKTIVSLDFEGMRKIAGAGRGSRRTGQTAPLTAPAPDQPLPPNYSLAGNSLVHPEAASALDLAVAPDLPLAVQPKLAEKPKAEGFMPVEAENPPVKTVAPPMPTWEDPASTANPAPDAKEQARSSNGPTAQELYVSATTGGYKPTPPEPQITLTLPTETQTPLSRFAGGSEPAKKPVFVLFRPFAALMNFLKNRQMR